MAENNKYKWGAALLGEIGKLADVAFDAHRQSQTQSPAARRKANAKAAEREEACTPCAVNARIADAKEKAKVFSRKTG